MKPVKSFQEFKSQLYESANLENLEEGIRDTAMKIGEFVKGAIKKIGEWFTGNGANFMNMLVAQDMGALPKGIKVFPTQGDIDIMKKNGVKVDLPKITEADDSFISNPGGFWNMNEEKVELVHPNPNVQNVGIKDFQEFLRDTVDAGEEGTPLLIWGAPGIGKTAIIEAIAKEYYGPKAKYERRIIDYDLMTMAPEDFFLPGLIGRDEKGDITSDTRAIRVPDKPLPLYNIDDPDGEAKVNGADGKGGIIFFDEIARASAPVQNVCLKLINERRVGDWLLGSKWVMVAAANREADDETGTYKFSSTLGNRFKQVNFAPEFKDWNEWASSAVDEEGEFVVSREILAFIRFNQKDWFYNLDPEVKAGTGSNTVFASPRSWTNASKALKIREKRALKDGRRMTDKEREEIVASLIGKDGASAFMGFIQLMRKIDVNEIKSVYTDPSKAPSFKDLKIDEKNALIAAVVFHIPRETKLKEPEQMNFIKWLISLKDGAFAIKAMVMMQESHPYLKEEEYWEDECKATLFDAYPNLTGGRD